MPINKIKSKLVSSFKLLVYDEVTHSLDNSPDEARQCNCLGL